MRVSGISIKIFRNILLLELYFRKYEEISDTFCRNKLQDEENLEKIRSKR